MSLTSNRKKIDFQQRKLRTVALQRTAVNKLMRPYNTQEHRTMDLSTWHSDLSVENAELDLQHITLQEIGRSIVSSIACNANSKVLCDLIEDFLALSVMHDRLEEEILRSNGCPTLEEHHHLHQESLTLFAGFLEQERAQCADRHAVATAVLQWMEHHISDTDLKVKQYLQETPCVPGD
jgi:hemerythrin-like metal-binding protein